MSSDAVKPIPPAPNECCEGGCPICVWDNYYDELNKWKTQQARIRLDEQEKAKVDLNGDSVTQE